MILIPSPYQEMFLITTFGIFLICQISIDFMAVSIASFDASWDATFTFIPSLGVIKSGIYLIGIILYGLFVLDEFLPVGTAMLIWMMGAIVATMFLWAITAIRKLHAAGPP